ncbi:TPA: DUF4129 domain-containing protein, partial [Thermoplasmata archaeon]|nr:DUF4129 domain-containing protein [Thermoplasmata archaeon]
EELITQSWSPAHVPGKTMHDTPLFVLTSGRTGSAAEEFTYDFKHHGRATIIGETTSGGGPEAEYKRVADLFDLAEPPENPNDRIVWSYNYLLRFLVKNRRVHIGSSMTHREIARMLEAIGYPSNLVTRITTLFEMARYAGTPMTESEMATMGSIVEQIKSTVLGGGRGYAA